MQRAGGKRSEAGAAGGAAHPPGLAALDAVLSGKQEERLGGRVGGARQAAVAGGGALGARHERQQVAHILLCVLL